MLTIASICAAAFRGDVGPRPPLLPGCSRRMWDKVPPTEAIGGRYDRALLGVTTVLVCACGLLKELADKVAVNAMDGETGLKAEKRCTSGGCCGCGCGCGCTVVGCASEAGCGDDAGEIDDVLEGAAVGECCVNGVWVAASDVVVANNCRCCCVKLVAFSA